MFKRGIKRKVIHLFNMTLLVAFLASFGEVSPANAISCPMGLYTDDGSCKCVPFPGQGSTQGNGAKFVDDYLAVGHGYSEFAKARFMDVLEDHLEKTSEMKHLRGNMSSSYCIEMYYKAQSLIELFISPAWTAILQASIETLLTWACEQALSAFENILNAACLPVLPDPPTLSLDSSTTRDGCDGVSLSDVIKVERQSPIDYKDFPEALQNTLKPISRWLGDNGHN